jgi:hypothetical protein
MLENLAKNGFIIPLIIIMFMLLYYFGGENIVFFRKKKHRDDPKTEEKLLSAVNRFARGRDFKVYGETTIEWQGRQKTFDAVLLSFFGTVIFYGNGKGGEIYGDSQLENWVQIFLDERKNFPNPLKDSGADAKIFREIYRSENIKFGQIDSMAVFTNNFLSLAVPKSRGAVSVEEVVKILESKKYVADNGADIPAMAAAIEKHIVTED